MTRLPGWELLLQDYIERTRDGRFCFGRRDCASWAAGAIEAVSGLIIPLPAYTSLEEAERVAGAIAKSLTDSVDAICARHSIPRVLLPFARSGDLVTLRTEKAQTIGIVDLDKSKVLRCTLRGVVSVPREMCLAAWRIG